MKEAFKKYLDKKNVRYDELSDNILSFSYYEHNYLFIYSKEGDPNYIRLCLPDIEQSEEITDEIKEKIIKFNTQYKVAKLILFENHVWISGESFVYNYLGVEQLFDRLIELLHSVLIDYHT